MGRFTARRDATACRCPRNLGSIIATLRHVIRSDGSYYRRLTGESFAWLAEPPDATSLGQLVEYVDDLEAGWERFLSTSVDAERTFDLPWDDGQTRVVPAGIVIAQALHHGCEHRAQICTTLTAIGAEAPALGVWEYAAASNRARVKTE